MRKYYHLVLAILLVAGSFMFLKDYFKGADKEKVQSLKALVESKSTAIAVLDSTYKETTIKIAGVKTKTYEAGYTFKVDEKEFKGKTNLSTPPETSEVEVKYLSSDPNVNSADPQKELNSEVEKDSSNVSLYLSLILLALAGFYFWRFNTARKQGQ